MSLIDYPGLLRFRQKRANRRPLLPVTDDLVRPKYFPRISVRSANHGSYIEQR
jgi:hypothetical protein